MENNFVLEMNNIIKEFPGVKALQDVTFQLADGQVHGLVGENGAGKSTLMKILAGIYPHDGGEIKFLGQTQKELTPKIIESLGIHFIHQERYIVPYLTVAETLFLGVEPHYSPFKFMNRRKMEKEATTLIKEKIGVDIQGNALVGDLTVGEVQLIQICRALMHDPKIIIFDEPTAVLAKGEQERLFEIIRDLKKNNIAIIYISHYFREILDLCDVITVLRNGMKITTKETEGLTVEDIATLIIGRELDEQFPENNREIGELVLDVEGLTHSKFFRNLNLQVRSGEIVGLTGLMGSGHDEVGNGIFDSTDIISGNVTLEGHALKNMTPEKAVKKGIGYIPADRRGLGIVQNMSVRENITLSSLRKVSKNGVIKSKNERSLVGSLIEKLGIKTPTAETLVGTLSGGNQQKVVISKWLSSGSKLYILNQPTAAVDVGAKAEIYSLISNMADEGAAILIISQDLPELVGMCDRILVMFRGELIDELEGKSATTDRVMVSMMGGEKREAVSAAN